MKVQTSPYERAINHLSRGDKFERALADELEKRVRADMADVARERAALAATAEPATHCGECAPEWSCFNGSTPCHKKPATFNPLACAIIPGDFNGPHGPLPSVHSTVAPTYSADDLRKVARAASGAATSRARAIANRWDMETAAGEMGDLRYEPLDLDAIIAKAVGR